MSAQELKHAATCWALRLRVNPRSIRVQDMRRKWGSCSASGTVTLAYDLFAQDDKFRNYVIVHELLHLKYATHGRVFKALMSAYVPDWKAMEDLRLASKRRPSPG